MQNGKDNEIQSLLLVWVAFAAYNGLLVSTYFVAQCFVNLINVNCIALYFHLSDAALAARTF